MLAVAALVFLIMAVHGAAQPQTLAARNVVTLIEIHLNNIYYIFGLILFDFLFLRFKIGHNIIHLR